MLCTPALYAYVRACMPVQVYDCVHACARAHGQFSKPQSGRYPGASNDTILHAFKGNFGGSTLASRFLDSRQSVEAGCRHVRFRCTKHGRPADGMDRQPGQMAARLDAILPGAWRGRPGASRGGRPTLGSEPPPHLPRRPPARRPWAPPTPPPLPSRRLLLQAHQLVLKRPEARELDSGRGGGAQRWREKEHARMK